MLNSKEWNGLVDHWTDVIHCRRSELLEETPDIATAERTLALLGEVDGAPRIRSARCSHDPESTHGLGRGLKPRVHYEALGCRRNIEETGKQVTNVSSGRPVEWSKCVSVRRPISTRVTE